MIMDDDDDDGRPAAHERICLLEMSGSQLLML
jgi:hypothetical protein